MRSAASTWRSVQVGSLMGEEKARSRQGSSEQAQTRSTGHQYMLASRARPAPLLEVTGRLKAVHVVGPTPTKRH